MVTSYTAHFNGRIAFHLYLNREKKDNILFSTIPSRLLIKCYQSELYHIKKALVFNDFGAHRQLESLANKILDNKSLHKYFYPEYLNGNFEVAEALIFLQNNFELKANTCYSKSFNKVEFFYLQQIFRMNNQYALKTGRPICLEYFKNEYLKVKCAMKSWETLSKNSISCSIIEYDENGVLCGAIVHKKALYLLVTL